MKIIPDVKSELLKTTVFYCAEDHSFDTTPHYNCDITFQIGYLHIGFDSHDMTAKSIWGYSPTSTWKKAKIFVPENVCNGSLVTNYSIPGITKRLDNQFNKWEPFFDKENSLFCLRQSYEVLNPKHLKLFQNVIITIDNNELRSLWIMI